MGDVGLWFSPTLCSMSIGESDGALTPVSLVEKEATILEDCIRVIVSFLEPSEGALIRVGLTPCSLLSVNRDLMRGAAILARGNGVMLLTHLAENSKNITYLKKLLSEIMCCRFGLDRVGRVTCAL